MPKYFIVYPRGGFVDIISVIEKCLNYAVKYDRQMIIDSRKSQMNDDIQKYIQFNHPKIHICDLDIFYSSIRELSVYPSIAKDKLNTIGHRHTNGIFMYITETGEKISLKTDLTKDYIEDIVLYCHCRDCGIGTIIFNYIRFTDFIINEYRKRLSILPKGYISFHIRNTDYKSDVSSFLETYKEKMLSLPFFLASDNQNNIDTIKSEFGSNVYTFSKGSTTGFPLHFLGGKTEEYKKQNIIDGICDLLLLASGKEIYYSQKNSGYSNLAVYLQKNSQLLEKIAPFDSHD